MLSSVTVGASPTGISVSPDGSHIYITNTDGTVSVIYAVTNQVTATLKAGTSGTGSFGNFYLEKPVCSGNAVSFTITVNYSRDPIIAVGAISGYISACAGSASTDPYLQQFTVSGIKLNGDIMVTAPAGFEVSLARGSGFGSSVTLLQAGGQVTGSTVYLRSSAGSAAGAITGYVTVSSAGTANQQVAVSSFIKAFPTVNAIQSQAVANGQYTEAINFTGTATEYSWVNDNPAVGLPASGTSNIASFKAVNTTSVPITANVTVMPQSAMYAYITNDGERTLSVINTVNNQVVAVIPVGLGPRSTAITPDNKTVYVTNEGSNTVSVIDAASNMVTATIPTGDDSQSLVLSTDGSKLYVANVLGNSISVISTATNAVVSMITTGVQPISICLSPDGTKLYSDNLDLGTVTVISTIDYSILHTISIGFESYDIKLSPDGTRLYVTGGAHFGTTDPNSLLYVWDTRTYQVVGITEVGIGGATLAISPDGSRIYVANEFSNTVSVIDAFTNAVMNTIKTGANPRGLSVSPDGSRIYVEDTGGNDVSVIDVSSNLIIATVPVGKYPTSYESFLTRGITCNAGKPITFTIKVLPDALVPIFTASTVFGSISACTGTASAEPNLVRFTVSGSHLLDNITVTAPVNFEISLTPGRGYEASLTLTQVASTVKPTIIYVRSAATAPAGALVGNVTFAIVGTPGDSVYVTGTISDPVSASVTISTPVSAICAGTPVTFTAVPVNGGSAPVYRWMVNGSTAGTNSTTFTSTTFNDGDMISCALTSNAACAVPAAAVSNPVTLTVMPAISASVQIAASANTVCAGTDVIFTAETANAGAAPVYQWMVNGQLAGTRSASFTSKTLNDGDAVSCTVTGNLACTVPAVAGSNIITMKIEQLPQVSVSAFESFTVGGSVVLAAVTRGEITNVTWSPSTGLSDYKVLQPIASPRATTTYTVNVQNAAGCTDTAQVTVEVLPKKITIPNTFTPNGDGINDTWDITGLEQYSHCTVQIYNRWGQSIYSSVGYSISWNGTYSQRPVPVGTYYYIIDLKNSMGVLSGYVVIIR